MTVQVFIAITVLFSVCPLIMVLDGQEEEKKPGTPSLTLLGWMIPPDPYQNLNIEL